MPGTVGSGRRGARRLYVYTYGCQMNVYDSGRVGALLRETGWTETDDPGLADLVFVNTCSVRESAVSRVRGNLTKLRALKLKNPAVLLAVGGCVAEQEGARLADGIPWLDLIVGPGRYDELPAAVESLGRGRGLIVLTGEPGTGRPTPEAAPETRPWPAGHDDARRKPSSQRLNKTSAGGGEARAVAGEARNPEDAGDAKTAPASSFLSIMTGCDNYCAYCVVPFLRGPEKSRPAADILAEARDLLARGAVEITLLGQNVNSYGRGGGGDFAALLEAVSALPGLKRLRFTTSHPKDFPRELALLFGKLPNLCEYLHLPVQSGSDRVLSAMGRRYDRARYLEIVSDLRSRVPGMSLSTDVIVGFPGETEAEFLETADLLETVGFDFIFSFKYSDRPMTRARLMEGKIPEEEKARRLEHVQTLQKKITLARHQALVGRTLEVLVEGRGRKPGQLTGRTRDMKIVNFPGPESLLGRLARATVVEAWPVSLLGTLAGDLPDGG
ncbi:MAG: MiaB/RimO family radical SAM methylthiotransferase [Deltaproteobacteria bacterium]|nr:MiaB/RimO family radical SAM methylthiotransferase [Deltaproteobacteria bacterium]